MPALRRTPRLVVLAARDRKKPENVLHLPAHALAALLLILGVLLSTVCATSASAQNFPSQLDICESLGMPVAPEGLEPDFTQCCDDFFACYSDNDCVFNRDSPRAMTPECFGCNVLSTACTGYALRGSVPTWDCPGSCSYSGVYCGASDGCGGVCVSDELCPLLMLRPEFYVLLF
jgi:hypothetical protein